MFIRFHFARQLTKTVKKSISILKCVCGIHCVPGTVRQASRDAKKRAAVDKLSETIRKVFETIEKLLNFGSYYSVARLPTERPTIYKQRHIRMTDKLLIVSR